MKYSELYKSNILNYEQFNEGELYQNILKSYGKDYGEYQNKYGIKPDKSTGYFEQVPSPDLAEDLLRKYYKPGFKLLDIGCGLGNILKLANSIGYESTGIEINENLKKTPCWFKCYLWRCFRNEFEFY